MGSQWVRHDLVTEQQHIFILLLNNVWYFISIFHPVLLFPLIYALKNGSGIKTSLGKKTTIDNTAKNNHFSSSSLVELVSLLSTIHSSCKSVFCIYISFYTDIPLPSPSFHVQPLNEILWLLLNVFCFFFVFFFLFLHFVLCVVCMCFNLCQLSVWSIPQGESHTDLRGLRYRVLVAGCSWGLRRGASGP